MPSCPSSTAGRRQSPCYACLFPPVKRRRKKHECATLGVFAPLTGIIGSMQAAEALKLLVGTGSSLAGRLQMLDARSMEWTEIRTPPQHRMQRVRSAPGVAFTR